MGIQQTGLGCGGSCKCGGMGSLGFDASTCPYGSNGNFCNPPDSGSGVAPVICPTGYVSYNGTCITIAQQQALANPVSPVAVVNASYSPKVVLRDSTSGTSLSGLRGALGGFTTGDTFTVAITGGAPNSTVAVSQNGGPATPMGITDGSGNWSQTNSWKASDAGSYSQVWTVGGTATNKLTFSVGVPIVVTNPVVVTPPPVAVPVVTYSPKISLTDNTSGDSLNGLRGLSGFNQGDSFTVSISGAQPSAPVYVQQVKDGTSSPTIQMGSTDDNGSFTVTGQWAASDAGLYTQYWLVGNQAVSPSPLMFTVVGSPAAPVANPVINAVAVTSATTNSITDWIGANPVLSIGAVLGVMTIWMLEKRK